MGADDDVVGIAGTAVAAGGAPEPGLGILGQDRKGDAQGRDLDLPEPDGVLHDGGGHFGDRLHERGVVGREVGPGVLSRLRRGGYLRCELNGNALRGFAGLLGFGVVPLPEHRAGHAGAQAQADQEHRKNFTFHGLEQIAGGVEGHGLPIVVVVGGGKDDVQAAAVLLQPLCQIDAVEIGHLDVQEGHVHVFFAG